jgi:hypothetical protein
MPDDVWSRVLSFLPVRDHVRNRLVCRKFCWCRCPSQRCGDRLSWPATASLSLLRITNQYDFARKISTLFTVIPFHTVYLEGVLYPSLVYYTLPRSVTKLTILLDVGIPGTISDVYEQGWVPPPATAMAFPSSMYTYPSFQFLDGVPGLVSLTVSNGSFLPGWLWTRTFINAPLAQLQVLRHLTLHKIPIEQEVLSCLRQLLCLESLDLFSTPIDNVGLAIVASMKSLRTLALCHCPYITDAGLVELTALSLHHLSLTYCDGVTGAVLAHLAALPVPLFNLNLTDCRCRARIL